MGKNNKARRAAKAKARAKAHAHNSARSAPGGGRHDGSSPGHHEGAPWDFVADGPLFEPPTSAGRGFAPGADRSPPPRVDQLLLRIIDARVRGRAATAAVTRLHGLPSQQVYRQTEPFLLAGLASVWSGGWQPAELQRQARLGCTTAAGARLVGIAIAVDDGRRRAVTLDARWRAQIEDLDLPRVDGSAGWIARWVRAEQLSASAAIDTLIDVVGMLGALPSLPVLIPPPATTRSAGAAGAAGMAGVAGVGAPSMAADLGGEVDPVLKRIRALLAKAESSEFEAEATALTAKAQELMTRHAIDAAAVEAGIGHRDERPVAIRVPIDRPYVDAKSLLLQVVAQSGRCRAVFHERLAMSTIAGFAADVAACEMLFTSLLLQAQHAMAQAAAGTAAGGRTRRQSFRSAFLVAYAQRIGARLAEINSALVSDAVAEGSSDFLPVLRSRADEVDDYVNQQFGDLLSSPVRGGYDNLGWASGQQAADRAQLNAGDIARS